MFCQDNVNVPVGLSRSEINSSGGVITRIEHLRKFPHSGCETSFMGEGAAGCGSQSRSLGAGG